MSRAGRLCRAVLWASAFLSVASCCEDDDEPWVRLHVGAEQNPEAGYLRLYASFRCPEAPCALKIGATSGTVTFGERRSLPGDCLEVDERGRVRLEWTPGEAESAHVGVDLFNETCSGISDSVAGIAGDDLLVPPPSTPLPDRPDMDASSLDAAVPPDAAVPRDAAAPTDAGRFSDAGSPTDAGAAADAAASADADGGDAAADAAAGPAP